MATSLLRLGRLGSLKCLLRESWTQRSPSAAALCTTADPPPKTAKKAKAASKTIEAAERASLLAYKPSVAFPSKLTATGFLAKDLALGESESSANVVTTETVVAAAANTEQPHLASQSVTEAATSEELTKETENATPAAEAISIANADERKTDSPVADTAAAEVAVEEAEITVVQSADDVTTASKTSDEAKVLEDPKDTSSSSSSDSDSDSDSDDENPEVKTKTETGAKSGGKAAEEKEAPVLTSKPVDVSQKEVESESVIAPSALFGESQEGSEAVIKAKPEEVVTPSTEAVGPGETLIDPAPVLSTSTTEAIPKVTSEAMKPEEVVTPSTEAVGPGETLTDPAPVLSTSTTEAIPKVTSEAIKVVSLDEMVDNAVEVKTAPTEDIVENETKAKTATEEAKLTDNVKTSATVLPEDTIEASPEEVADTIVEASPGVAPKDPRDVFSEAVQEVVAKPKSEAASETVARAVGETGIEPAPSEELEDPAPVAADSVESLAETEVVETSEEQAPEKAPEPEPEPFDNTTYKNLQHHHYNMYTFADMDVEMSKHRLTQPSSGRPSPRH